MSRMSAPTMEVVRFKEADVIVASGGYNRTSMQLKGFGTGTQGNGWLRFNSTEYSAANNYSGFHNDFQERITDNYDYSGTQFLNNGVYRTIGDLINNENTNESVLAFSWDGTYIWQNGQFEKQ